jgi:hypothetical protein
MPNQNDIHVCLKIVGCDDPAGLSTHLGLDPTQSWVRGDVRGRRTATYSAWILNSPAPRDADLKDRCARLLDLLEPSRAAFANLPAGAVADLSVAAYWREGCNPGFRFPASLVRRATGLGLSIDLDVYCLSPAPSVAEDPDGDVVFGADSSRDGVFLKQTYEGGGWIEIFRSEADGSSCMSAELRDLSLERLDALVTRARRQLPTHSDADVARE